MEPTNLRSTITIDGEEYEPSDVQYVEEQFPECELYLAERLGRAISGRRRYLASRAAHRDLSSNGVERSEPERSHAEQPTNNIEQPGSQPIYPYICTVPDCPTPTTLFHSRNEWFRHEMKAHRAEWHCMTGCSAICTSEADLDTHFRTAHPDFWSSSVDSIERSARRVPSDATIAWCALCKRSMTLRELMDHLGMHLEQLALFALVGEGGDDGREEEEERKQLSGQAVAVAEDGDGIRNAPESREENDCNADQGFIKQNAESRARLGKVLDYEDLGREDLGRDSPDPEDYERYL